MRINVCVPHRGDDKHLCETVHKTVANSTVATTRVVIGFDEDEFTKDRLSVMNSEKIVCTVDPREDSLGAKYERCAQAYQADLFVIAKDHIAITTPGWDAILSEYAALFTDGIGFLHFGKEPNGEDLPAMIAVTKKTVELAGFGLMVPHYPFWWGNTTWDEIGWMTERVLYAPVEVDYPSGFPPRNRRDIAYWAEFFDKTRPLRCRVADKLISTMSEPPHRRRHLKQTRNKWIALFKQRNAALRDPAFAGNIETQGSVAEPMDARHERLKANAERILKDMVSQE